MPMCFIQANRSMLNIILSIETHVHAAVKAN
jgi:hypothetical protein